MLNYNMLYIQKKAPSSSTICKKNQIDIINFTPTGCYQKRSIKKKHPVLACQLFNTSLW